MAAGSNKVGTLGDALLIFYEMGKGLFAHAVEAGAHIVCCAIGREYGHTLQSGFLVEAVNVLNSYIVVQFIGLCLYVVVVINHAFGHESANSFLVKAV